MGGIAGGIINSQAGGTAMIFVEFVAELESDGKHYFVSKNLQSVLDDTKGGTDFAGIRFTSHREISEAEARALKLDFLASGIEAVKGGCLSYKLRTPSTVSQKA